MLSLTELVGTLKEEEEEEEVETPTKRMLCCANGMHRLILMNTAS